jgi:hypothetical protein
LRGIFLAFTLLASFLVQASAGERMALLIGNAHYNDDTFNLTNPGNDARAMALALQPLGFETEVMFDASAAAAEAGLSEFGQRAAGADIALVFFAGHGVQIEGDNRLITADLNEATLDGIVEASVSLDAVRIALAEAKPELGIIVLDACRNNPLTDSGGAFRGLARAQGGAGLLIAYATDPGNVAYDGTGPDSLFTAALLDNLATPGVEVRLMFGRVRQAVIMASGGRQIPWVEEAVLGEHFLNAARPEAPPSGAIYGDLAAWREATASGDSAAFRRYLDRMPDGLFRPFAEERLSRKATPGAPIDAGRVLGGADPVQIAAALETLGFLSAPRDIAEPPLIEAAFSAYASQMGGPATSLDGLYLDAAQATVMLAAGAAQRIRTDIALLQGIETALGTATRARGELAGLAVSRAAAREALPAADRALAGIRASKARVQARLDDSRSYYGALVARGGQQFGPYLQRSLVGIGHSTRGFLEVERQTVEDAALYVKHATDEGVGRPEGSMAWLADFLPGS